MIVWEIVEKDLCNALFAQVHKRSKTTNVKSLSVVQKWMKFAHILHWNVKIVMKITKLPNLDVWLGWKPKLKLEKKKFKKSKAKDKHSASDKATDKTSKEEPAVGPSSIELDTEVINCAKNIEKESSGLSSLETNMPEDSQNNW